MSAAANHYDEQYFSWQKSISAFGGWANSTKFAQYINPSNRVLDFGCGGGYLLKQIGCAEAAGVEVNEVARREAQRLGVTVYASTAEIVDEWADVIISNHALEHCPHPLRELQALYPKLKAGSRAVFVVPCEAISYAYHPNDMNYHLHSWSPMALGNLFTEAGFHVEESKPYIHKWPPHYRLIARVAGRRLFDLCCRLYGQIERSSFQVRIVARKP
jgi:SAM-dependent methyltransferase